MDSQFLRNLIFIPLTKVASAHQSINNFRFFVCHVIDKTFSHPYIWTFPENVTRFLFGRLFKSVNFLLLRHSVVEVLTCTWCTSMCVCVLVPVWVCVVCVHALIPPWMLWNIDDGRTANGRRSGHDDTNPTPLWKKKVEKVLSPKKMLSDPHPPPPPPPPPPAERRFYHYFAIIVIIINIIIIIIIIIVVIVIFFLLK